MADHQGSYTTERGFIGWWDQRLPIIRGTRELILNYPTPKNLSYWWTFGSILGAMLIIQIVTGLALSMHYTPNAQLAFDSVELIKRDVNGGRLIQAVHSVGASMFFLALYIHLARGMYYGSFKAPREALWLLGCLIFVLSIATAFFGYVLPWGQMSYWAATVITNIFAAIPVIGDPLLQWLRGGFAVDNPTLNRFFSLHYLLPFVIGAIVVLHIWALHIPGNNNPTGVEVKSGRDTVPFHPYYLVKDLFAVVVFLIPFAWVAFFAPDILGHADNYIPADPLVTPPEIVPEWYFLPYYAILRAIDFPIWFIDSKLLGVIVFGAAIVVLFFVPWLDRARTRSGRYRPAFRIVFWIFVLDFLMLMYLGSKPPEGIYVVLAKIGVLYYFVYFLIILPLLSRYETPRPLPASISESVLRPARS
ncbi:MAG TPA: cytochrome b N-terminal domain-containing protein [Devosia sp.]|nr:cytochrome b N-terminal domain-containing protein [Devosia sp.]